MLVSSASKAQAGARQLYGDDSDQLTAVTEAWQTVGVLPTADPDQPDTTAQPDLVSAQPDLMSAAQTELQPSTPPSAPPTPQDED